jgi:hypothetical protein
MTPAERPIIKERNLGPGSLNNKAINPPIEVERPAIRLKITAKIKTSIILNSIRIILLFIFLFNSKYFAEI